MHTEGAPLSALSGRRLALALAVMAWSIAVSAAPAAAGAPAAGAPAAGAPAADDLVFVIPDAGDGWEKRVLESFLTFDQLPAPGGRPEDRIAEYEAAFAPPSSPGDAPPRRRPARPGFLEVALDFAALFEPEDALAAAHGLTGAPGSRPLYDALGVALLGAARQARFGDDGALALGYLDAAAHAFDLADREPGGCGAGDRAGDRDSLHRALVRLEEAELTGSDAPRLDAHDLLLRQIEATPTGAVAEWAWRVLGDPAAYAGEPFDTDAEVYHVGGDVRPPVKVFAPPPRYSRIARQARVRGVVIIQAVIDRHGHVAAFKMLKDLPGGLADESLRTLATWLFEPATLAGEPVPVFYNLTMTFRM